MQTKVKQLCDKFVADPVTPKYISPSQLNNFLGNKMQFIGRILGFDRKDNINFQKGNTLERAVNFFFCGVDTKHIPSLPTELALGCQGNPEKSIAASMHIFNIEAQKMEKFDETTEFLPALTMKAINRYLEYNGKPDCQVKVQGDINGVTVMGYTDYQFTSIVSDCKVTGRTPSEMSQSHKNAAYIYQKLTNKQVIYDYFIPLKKEPKHVAYEFEEDQLTANLVDMALDTVSGIYSDLENNPELIYKYSAMFLSDPDQGFGNDDVNYFLP